MESTQRGRPKKLLIALEAQQWDLHCVSCSQRDKYDRGCKKPGSNYPHQGAPFRYGSPYLGALIQEECPTGYVLREAPWAWDCISTVSFFENATPKDYAQTSRFMRGCIGVINSEQNRMREEAQDSKKTKWDAAYGAKVRKLHG